MLLELDDLAIEIREGMFVCIDDGNASLFCEWESLTPDLKSAFTTLQENFANAIEKFLASPTVGNEFAAVSEQYGPLAARRCPIRNALRETV